MKVETMTRINSLLSAQGISYSLADATDEDLTYPYWTGEYSSLVSGLEDKIVDSEFRLIGIGKSWLGLKTQEETILQTLDGYRAGLLSGMAILVSFDSSVLIPCEDKDFKRIEMVFSIKEFINE
jgi:hypothetical protein